MIIEGLETTQEVSETPIATNEGNVVVLQENQNNNIVNEIQELLEMDSLTLSQKRKLPRWYIQRYDEKKIKSIHVVI